MTTHAVTALRSYRAAYVMADEAGAAANEAPFWRLFDAEDLEHAREQAVDGCELGEVLVGVFDQSYVLEASRLCELLAAVAGAGFLGRLLVRARLVCDRQSQGSLNGGPAGAQAPRCASSEAERDRELLGDVIASLRALESTEGVLT